MYGLSLRVTPQHLKKNQWYVAAVTRAHRLMHLRSVSFLAGGICFEGVAACMDCRFVLRRNIGKNQWYVAAITRSLQFHTCCVSWRQAENI